MRTSTVTSLRAVMRPVEPRSTCGAEEVVMLDARHLPRQTHDGCQGMQAWNL